MYLGVKLKNSGKISAVGMKWLLGNSKAKNFLGIGPPPSRKELEGSRWGGQRRYCWTVHIDRVLLSGSRVRVSLP